MKRFLLSVAALPLVIGGLSLNASADDGINILSNFKFNGEIRPRYEYADVADNSKDAAHALTARTTLGVGADMFQISGLSSYLEVSAVTNFGYTDYNDGSSTGNAKYDKIVDPQQARMTQAYIDYKLGKTLIRAGRQDVNIDNQRFVGTVDWRQMKQTFDAIAVVDNTIENLSLLGAYVYGYIGVGTATESTDTKSVLLHATYKVNNALNVTAYDYLLASISDTYGAALTGNVDVNMAKLDYRAEYAKQKDPSLEYQIKNVKADSQYYNLDLGANISGILAGLNYEFLGGSNGTDGKTAFQTPLGTKHAFNGWADVFLASTPTGGLIDKNIRIGYQDKVYGKLLGVYHQFNTDKDMGGESDLGTEFDAMYTNKVPGIKNLTGMVKYADYMHGKVVSGTSYNDKKVAWLMLDYKF